jgi:hypothetical protein
MLARRASVRGVPVDEIAARGMLLWTRERMHPRGKEPAMAIHIVTDSMACLPQRYVEEHGDTIVPLRVSLDGEYFRDGIDITDNEFYRRLVAGAKGGSTQPSPEEFASAYGAILERDPAEASCCFTSVHACQVRSMRLSPSATSWIRLTCSL